MKNSKKALFIGVFSVILTSVLYLAGNATDLLRTSLLDLPDHKPFDGTVYPIKKAPNWVGLSSEKWDMNYSSFSNSDLLDFPYYDPSELKKNVDSLTWGNSEHDRIRNSKITYSVPYLGSYLLDGIENAGSHPAVDIKLPKGTPVYSIANGVVIKATNQSNGFGQHVVIQHNNFPSLTDPNAKETLYSSYSHLDSFNVSEGEVVTKGQFIGKVGDSGTATTDHLHFQIDTESAPWHPYWPFTFAEAQAEGLDFFTAINAGLGADKARKTTINPMKYVQKYMDGSVPTVEPTKTVTTNTGNTNNNSSNSNSNSTNAVAGSYVSDSSNSENSNGTFVSEDNSEDNSNKIDDLEVSEEVVEEIFEEEEERIMKISIVVSDDYTVGESGSFELRLRDQFNDVYDLGFRNDLIIESVNGAVRVKNSIIGYSSFDSNDGTFIGSIIGREEGKDRLFIEYNGKKYYSDWFDVKAGKEITTSKRFKDITPTYPYYKAINSLADRGIIAGYPDSTFKPQQTVSRVEALKFILEGIKAELDEGSLPFNDVSTQEWYAKYLYTAVNDGIVEGYSDGTFKPSNTVNRAEFYKILFNGMGVEVEMSLTSDPFDDVSKTDWFAPYFVHAREIGIIDKNAKIIRPSEGMSRGEVANAIYRLMEVIN